MRRRFACGLALGAMAFSLVASTGHASVKSQALYARGLVPFNGGNWSEAFALFNRAVEADRTDATALYYRGLTQARQGNTTAAIDDLGKAQVLNPTLPHVALDLGIACFSAGQHEEARRSLERAYQQGTERLTAAFFLGLVQYRLGDREAALRYLNESRTDPELAGAASYYAGLIDAAEGRGGAARTAFGSTVKALPDSEIGIAAQQYLTTGSVPGGPPGKKWSVYGGLNLEYDTNVTLGPGSSDFVAPLAVTGKSDGRAVLSAGGRYSFLDTPGLRLGATYDFSQSVHFDLREFDLQGHRLGVQAASQWKRLSYGLAAGYNYFLLDYSSFFQEGYGTPWVTLAEGERAATQAFYTIRGRDFLEKPFDPGRDAMNHSFGLRQYFTLFDPSQVLALGYRYEIEDTVSNGPQGRAFAYHGHQFDASLQMRVLRDTGVQLAYLLNLSDYDNANSGFTASGFKKRSDLQNQFLVGLVQPITDHLDATLSYVGVIHGSNVNEFEYDRHIISAGLRLTY